VGHFLADTPRLERRNPLIYTDEQKAKYSVFVYIVGKITQNISPHCGHTFARC
jgi:hypothetical protein